jgi:hypothetical protein
MDSLPSSSKDIATIRILGNRNDHTKDFDENDDINFVERYFYKTHTHSKKEPDTEYKVRM